MWAWAGTRDGGGARVYRRARRMSGAPPSALSRAIRMPKPRIADTDVRVVGTEAMTLLSRRDAYAVGRRMRLALLLVLAATVALAGAATQPPPAAAARKCATKATKHHRKAHGRKRHAKRCKKRRAQPRPRPVRRTRPARPQAAPAPARLAPLRPAPAPTVPRLFAPDSVWNAPLAPAAPLDPSSKACSAAFTADIQRQIRTQIGPWVQERDYSTPLYTVGSAQPKVPVKLDTGPWGASLQAVLSQGVPIPPDARPAAGTDGHLTVWQPSTDTLWELWRAVRRADGWHASWGGAMKRVSTSPGYYTNAAWDSLSASNGWGWGSTASSLPVIAGTVRIDELKAGRIDHALALDVPAPCGGVFSWPAQRTDGTSTSPDCMPEGAHLRLDPSLDLSKLRLPPITRMLAEAAQRYGMIIRDRTGHATGFFMEDPTPTGNDPYNGPNGFYGGKRPWAFLPQFPWASGQLLRMSQCTRAPCPPPSR